jgi:hypothetical protein
MNSSLSIELEKETNLVKKSFHLEETPKKEVIVEVVDKEEKKVIEIPKGSWIHSQNKYEIVDNILYADLYDANGNLHSKSIVIHKDFTYSNNNGNFEIEDYNNTLFIYIGNQLGNCLRIITSCIIIAEYYQMNVFIDLNRDYLADKDRQVISDLFSSYCKSNVSNKYELLKYDDYVNYDKMPCTNYDLICEGRFNKPTNINNFGIYSNIYSVIPGDMDNETYIRKKIKLYKSISFPDFLLNNVRDFLSSYDLSKFIGFHIRYTDNLNDTCKKQFNTNINIFFKKLESYTNANILICSDNNQLLNNIKNKKNKKNNLIFPNQCSHNLYQHLYEMILLSKTSLIIGTSSSTFSYESAFFEGTNIELYEENEWKLYSLSNYKD